VDGDAPSASRIYRRAQRFCIHLGLARRAEFSFWDVFDRLAQANASEALGEQLLENLVGEYDMPGVEEESSCAAPPPWRGAESAAALTRSVSVLHDSQAGCPIPSDISRATCGANSVASVAGSVENGLPHRDGYSKVTFGGQVFLFGGRNESGPLKDFWMFSSETCLWADLSHTVPLALSPRFGHNATLRHKRMVISGGYDGQHSLSDIWECDLVHLLWIRSSQICHPGDADEPRPLPVAEVNANASGGDWILHSGDVSAPGPRTLLLWWGQLPEVTVICATQTIQAAARKYAFCLRVADLLVEAKRKTRAAARIQAGVRGWKARQSPSKMVWY